MKLQITTDYAIRVIIYLAQNEDKVTTVKEMAERLGITGNYLIKIVTRLKQEGYIKSIQGPAGGYYLVKKTEDITLYDIVLVIEGEIRINRCLEEDGYCSRDASQYCPVHKIFESVQNDLIASLKRAKISEILKAGDEML
ncbi:MAG: RrF2 family transcriptional regulator [Lacrimispora sphenoides]|uniref:Rrf2 family protein n=1 Tax=Lacrimispora sphenoides JCM 1415 TaxID=1297793 RepID=A0ABY1C1F3_9FIRM|nr:Rrf2 family transcriptional regulator [Lacrimispora sphenoides]SET52374.1 Rrf2 family protein [[Clostridium] sphenoides JCM 1415]SUY49589.1 rrf2 family protein [Lacrimispora sphenoides]